MDSPVSVFDICQAHAQLESDYNRDGIVRERFSNRRRNMSTGLQLARIGYEPRGRWVDVLSTDTTDPGDEDVKDIYLINVLKWGLPLDADMRAFMAERYTPEFLSRFSAWG